MKIKLCGLFMAAYLNAMFIEAFPVLFNSNKMFIYGKITTISGETYQGQIRWGKEEAFWFDHFNSEKPRNEFLKYLDDDQLDDLKGDGNRKSWNWNWNSNSCGVNTHTFVCHFGDIRSIEPRRGERVDLTLKNDQVIRLDGGSNDIGAKVKIHDEEIGTLSLDWDMIEKVEFMDTPTDLKSAFGEPLYGTVHTYSGEFTGYLQWDHDERLTLDELNGDTESGSFDIAFGNIASIESTRRGSKVTLRSGRKLHMTGSNDVCSDNRGIIINLPGQGRVDVTWDEFEKIEFSTAPAGGDLSYASYSAPKNISGRVMSKDGKEYTGDIVFDLDEEYELEILDGKRDKLEFLFPFRYVRSISPKTRKTSEVKLRDGSSYELEDMVDVSEDNDGILVFSSDDDYQYIPWDEVEKIELN